MVIDNYRPTRQERNDRKRGTVLKWAIIVLLLLFVAATVGVALYEMRTSRFQAQKISSYAATLTYNLKPGPTDAVIYPSSGPFDLRLGYVELPDMLERVKAKGMEVTSQARFSPALLDYTASGYFVPFPEKTQTGLRITDAVGDSVFEFHYPQRIYPDFKSIPPLLVQSLLFIENRELLDTSKPYLNPAIDWKRFTRASLQEVAKTIGFNYKRIGGSTLATQIEKFRHSPAGITEGPREKLQQMASASVRAYRQGAVTLPARQDLVLEYVNSVPLSGAPGYGEVNGMADGLWVWFGADPHRVTRLLQQPEAVGDTLRAQGQALRQVLSLIIAQRRPSFYLSEKGRPELSSLTGGYLRLLAKNGYISPALCEAGLASSLRFRNFGSNPVASSTEATKGALMARTHMAGLLHQTLYDLDRLDLSATTTLQRELQQQVSDYLLNLGKPAFATKAGILGDHMLTLSQTPEVQYSFTLLERTDLGNLVRVQTDNTGQPFDINEGSKLELGSTAKLRVLITYLEIVAEIHQKFAGQPQEVLRHALQQPQDNLTAWGLRYLLQAKDTSLPTMLAAALQRRYTASPRETFFTGGGAHTFHNYRSADNGRKPTVREAFLKSINLPFVRLLRDIVRYTTYQQISEPTQLLGNDRDPRRRAYLEQYADREGKVFLLRFWRKYEGKTADERLALLLKSMRQSPVKLAAMHRYLYPRTDSVAFEAFLRQQLPKEKLTHKRVMEMYDLYGPDAFNLSDQGYITRIHPLELWLLDYLNHHPNAEWQEVVGASQQQRQEIYAWLFRTRFKSARDSRIRTMLELEAFAAIQQRWQRLGYPFGQLVPSLATALGSSGDRPEALAELMGIILNNGKRYRTLRIASLHFAADTPYETSLQWQPEAGEQVLEPAVAAAVREALLEVVDEGTARRLQGGLAVTDGGTIPIGGKTGTGDNRFITLSARGQRISSRAINRTATFVFFIGNNHFGTLTAFVPGRAAEEFHFTSSLPVQVLRGMAPILEKYVQAGSSAQPDTAVVQQAAEVTKAVDASENPVAMADRSQ